MKKEETKESVKVADLIWSKIKGIDLNLWGISGQYVEKLCTRLDVLPDELYLKLSKPAVLPLLEEYLRPVKINGRALEVEQTKDHTIIKLAS